MARKPKPLIKLGDPFRPVPAPQSFTVAEVERGTAVAENGTLTETYEGSGKTSEVFAPAGDVPAPRVVDKQPG